MVKFSHSISFPPSRSIELNTFENAVHLYLRPESKRRRGRESQSEGKKEIGRFGRENFFLRNEIQRKIQIFLLQSLRMTRVLSPVEDEEEIIRQRRD